MSNIQTSAFVKKLAANDRPTRTAALESLKKFLSSPRDLPLFEFEKLWKGLFYSMWFSDRPRPQQRLANDLGELYLIIPEKNYKNFALAFWIVMAKEWSAIDHHRIDKFLLLVRRVLFNQMKKIRENDWNEKMLEEFISALKQSPLSGDQRVPNGIPFHLIDVFADEAEKMMFEDIQEDEEDEEDQEKRREIIDNTPLAQLIEPFVTLSKEALLKTLREKIKEDLLDDDRVKSWKVLEEEIEESDEEEQDGDDDDDEEEDADENEEDDEEQEESEDEWNGFD